MAQADAAPPHLSHSRVSRFLHCPEQYRCYYVEGLRPRVLSANLAFGKALHEALARHFRDGEDPLAVFSELWEGSREAELAYSRTDTWERLRDVGDDLLERFITRHRERIGDVRAVEQGFSLSITALPEPLVGIVDLVARLDGRLTVIDFKTTGGLVRGHDAVLSDQLTAYQLAEPEVEQAALCVFVKAARPRVQWQVTQRGPAELVDYLQKVRSVSTAIQRGEFFRRPGLWCSWCDYLPLCTGDERRARQTLIQLP